MEDAVPRTIAELDESAIAEEEVEQLSNAVVLWADYRLLAADFPGLLAKGEGCDLGTTRDRIAAWLVASAGIISQPQSIANEVNDDIHTKGNRLVAFRPPRYGRSVVREVRALTTSSQGEASELQGLLDVKGSGVGPGISPRCSHDASGLLHLPDAFSELIKYKIINAIFSILGVDIRGVGIYAILYLGFWFRLPHGQMVPAGCLVRQGHRRFPGNVDLPQRGSEHQLMRLWVEMTLRQFGLTSSGLSTQIQLVPSKDGVSVHYGGVRLPHVSELQGQRIADSINCRLPFEADCINIQMAREVSWLPPRARLYDFGQYEFRSEYRLPLLSLVSDRPVNWGGILRPDDPLWVIPRRAISLNPDMVGPKVLTTDLAEWRGPGHPRVVPGIDAFCYELAASAVQSKLPEEQLSAHIDKFVAAATRDARKELQKGR